MSTRSNPCRAIGTAICTGGNNEVARQLVASAREPIEQGVIMGQPTEEVNLPIQVREQTEGSHQPFIGQPSAAGIYNGLVDHRGIYNGLMGHQGTHNGLMGPQGINNGLMDPRGMSPLPIVPSRYPDRPMELLVENLNFSPVQEVPLYQVHSGGRQPMQYVELARGMQFNEGAGARPLTSLMYCGSGRTDASESFDGVRFSISVEETGQFPEQTQASGRMRPSSFLRQLTLNRLSPPEPMLTPGQICNGNYIWKIERFSQLPQDASNEIVTSLESPPIYTDLYGYKFYTRIFPNGISGGDGRHVGLFVGIMQGDFDNRLQWPFCGQISLSMLDQSSDAHSFCNDVSCTFMANRNLGAFQKPAAAGRYNTLYGYAEFAPFDMVCASQYCKEDTVMIKIEIQKI